MEEPDLIVGLYSGMTEDDYARLSQIAPTIAQSNLSPHGLDTFRVLGRDRVAWLDLTGSGIETVAHLKADGRITLMFCAFSGPPRILRLYGRGRVHEPTDEAYGELRPRFRDAPGGRAGERAIVDVVVDRVSSSCGFGVPLMDYVGARDELAAFTERKGERGMAAYRERFNARSIDELPGLESTGEGSRT